MTRAPETIRPETLRPETLRPKMISPEIPRVVTEPGRYDDGYGGLEKLSQRSRYRLSGSPIDGGLIDPITERMSAGTIPWVTVPLTIIC